MWPPLARTTSACSWLTMSPPSRTSPPSPWTTKKYHVLLTQMKTKLLCFSAPRHKNIVQFAKLTSQIKIGNTEIQFSDTKEHVGIVRSSSGIFPTFLTLLLPTGNICLPVLPAGLARRHNANQAAALSVQNSFALPFLLSGKAPLTLASNDVLDKHFESILRSLMKLPDKSPDPVVYFLAGTLPIKAIIHRMQLSLVGMISRLHSNILT